MEKIKIYGEIPMLKKLFKDIVKTLKFKNGYIPLNMSVALAMDLKKQGLTRR